MEIGTGYEATHPIWHHSISLQCSLQMAVKFLALVLQFHVWYVYIWVGCGSGPTTRQRAMGPDAETCWGSLGAFINNCVLSTSPTQQLVLNTMQLAQSQPGKQLCLIKK